MATWVLTAVSVAGLGAAAAMIVRAGGLPVLLRHPDQEEPVRGWAGARRVLRGIAVAFGSGMFAGGLVAGLGGRLFMRIAAATSPVSAQGAITEAEEVVGEVTLGGSIGFVVFVGLFGGGVLGLLYRLLRAYLPGPAWVAGLTPAVIAAGLLGTPSGLTDPENRDFAILEPTWLMALMIVVLVGLFGATLGAVHEWLDARVPPLGRQWKSALWYLPVLPYAVVPTFTLALLAPVAVGAAASEQARVRVAAPGFRRAVSIVIAAVALFSLLRFVNDVARIAL